MKDFVFSYPTKVYFGKGILSKALNDQLSQAGKTIMLAYGGGSIKKNGVYEEITQLLSVMGKNIVEFPGIMSNPTYDMVQKGAALARKEKADYILAAGGGSVIDCSKIIAAQAKTEQDLWAVSYTHLTLPTILRV